MPRAQPSWSEVATARLYPLWRRMPSRGRASSEAGFVVTAVLAPSMAVGWAGTLGPSVAIGAPLLVLLAWGAALLGGGDRWGAARWPARLFGLLGLTATVGALAVLPWWLLVGSVPRRLAQLLGDGPLVAMTVRNLLVLGLVGLLLRSDRQGIAQLGLPRRDAASEALFGLAALAGAFAVHLLVSIALGGLAALASRESVAAEASARAGTVVALVSNTSLPAFAAVMVLAAAFEEVVFRGFVLPRVRHGLGSWLAALLIAAALFGLGHLYEGPLAVIQTAALGVYFGLLLIWRAHLLSAIVAHAGFNAVMVALALWLRHRGMLGPG